MANKIYPLWKQELLQGSSNTSLTGNIKAVLVDSADYTYSDSHQFLSDISSGARVATSSNLASKTYSTGIFDAADITFSSVTGDVSEILILYVDTGVEATSRLVLYLDSSISGMPVTPNGGDINVAWDNSTNKIFAL